MNGKHVFNRVSHHRETEPRARDPEGRKNMKGGQLKYKNNTGIGLHREDERGVDDSKETGEGSTSRRLWNDCKE
jgi:hypothetical protein